MSFRFPYFIHGADGDRWERNVGELSSPCPNGDDDRGLVPLGVNSVDEVARSNGGKNECH
ncbi:hypothetical protein L798_03705 [Zootermopsis nevadensis]|uniref:Uncharacterized protein n=1 Tax=Zootermopsis nevadensis TaxID=136037 RepID=A0A067RBI8_ZOONE|nr:hypothetical protein L798_03705 [Zootermopsis nevadensis]